MDADTLRQAYRAYLDCLNRQARNELSHFVTDDAEHNDRPLGLSGYRDMLVNDFLQIPDLRFESEFVISEPPMIFARLAFDCSPRSEFLESVILKLNRPRIPFLLRL